MPVIETPPRDLRTLVRESPSVPSASAGATVAPVVPAPRFSWTTRLLIPGAILLVLLLLIGYTAQDVLWPARAVRVVPVVYKAGVGEDAGSASPSTATSTATVQAPGWIEPDPYAISVSALTDGIV